MISVFLNNKCLILNGSPRIKLHGDDIDGIMDKWILILWMNSKYYFKFMNVLQIIIKCAS